MFIEGILLGFLLLLLLNDISIFYISETLYLSNLLLNLYLCIGAGICDGLFYGDNAKAAFITRGLVEISRLAVAAGAHPLTLSGLAGMGDLIATC